MRGIRGLGRRAGAGPGVLSAQFEVPAPVPDPRNGEKPGPARGAPEFPLAAGVRIYGGAEKMCCEPHSELNPALGQPLC